ncbi:MAG: energy transducer TonB [Acidobacteriota bacterium]
MPTSVVPKIVIDPGEPQPTGSQDGSPQEPQEQRAASIATSRWVDYDTHELLEMISELEDERRWARLREGLLWAVLVHIILLSALTWIPKYVLHVPQVIDPFDAIQQRKDLKYLDLPPDLIKKYQPKVAIKPVQPKVPQIDRKTLEALNKPTPPPVAPPPAPEQPKLTQPQVQQPAPLPPKPQSQSQLEAPQPRAVPARPNFAMGSQNPADQLRDAMKGAARSRGYDAAQLPSGPGLAMHPGAGTGGVEILSDTQGIDFTSWLIRWHRETERNWDPLIPDEVNPPILKSGMVVIRFKVLPNGRLMDGSMVLEGRSGDTSLDRAAWGALTGSSYPPLPSKFHGPYLELRAVFMYNMHPNQ